MTNVAAMTNSAPALADMARQNLKAESLMLEVQILVAKDFDEQMRRIGEQIKFMSGIKKSYRDNINHIQNFMTQSPVTSRKDGKRFINASFSQMAGLYGSFIAYSYDVENMNSRAESMTLPDVGDKHELDEPDANGQVWVPDQNGKIATLDLRDYFANGARMTDAEQSRQFATRVGDDDSSLPFYYGHEGNVDENGFPKFAVFTDELDKMVEQIKNKLTEVDEDAELLSASLNALTAQRKAALDGANQLMSKMDQIRGNVVDKI